MRRAARDTEQVDGDDARNPSRAVQEILVLVKELEADWHLDDRIAYMTRRGDRGHR